MKSYIVSKVIQVSPSVPLLFRGESQPACLREGTALRVGDRLDAQDGLVEVRDDYGLVLRLGPSAQLDYVLDPQGGVETHPTERPSLIFFGEVYKFRHYIRPLEVWACCKYRTSCWICITNLYARNLDAHRDAFYAIAGEAPIWEWDEEGAPFTIVKIPEGHKAVLRHDSTVHMRERYKVEEIVRISAEEWDYIAANFMNPKRWLMQTPLKEAVTAG